MSRIEVKSMDTQSPDIGSGDLFVKGDSPKKALIGIVYQDEDDCAYYHLICMNTGFRLLYGETLGEFISELKDGDYEKLKPGSSFTITV